DVYSRYFFTRDSLSSMVNYGHAVNSDKDTRNVLNIKTSAYFDTLVRSGYNIHVYQTPFANFCASPSVTFCRTLYHFDPLSPYVPEERTAPKLRNTIGMVLSFFRESYTSNITASMFQATAGAWPQTYTAQAFPLWFEQLSQHIMEVEPGTMVFAHLLMPHSPYKLTSSCELSQNELQPYNLANRSRHQEWSDMRVQYYEGYFEQITCLYKRLDALFVKMRQSHRFDDAIIVIHGDHGSRISKSNYYEEMSREDFLDNYPTYFSIRAPTVEAGYDRRFVSLQEVFTSYFAPDAPLNGASRNTVFVQLNKDSKRDFIEVEMPLFANSQ
ncbi:MAG: sulfatase-like hydrolase/transferase, partial [Gammaproteobacteria bacterium]